MIKKLSFKFVLVFSLLVVSIFITSSCYATALSETYSYLYSLGGSLVDKGIPLLTNNDIVGLENYSNMDLSQVVYLSFDSNFYCCIGATENGFYNPSNIGLKIASSGDFIINKPYYVFTFDNNSRSWNYIKGSTQYSLTPVNSSSVFTIYTETNRNIFLGSSGTSISDTLIYDWKELFVNQSVIITHEFQSDTSAKVNFDYSSYGTDYILQYSLSGVEVNADLTAPVKLRNPVTYSSRSNKLSC